MAAQIEKSLISAIQKIKGNFKWEIYLSLVFPGAYNKKINKTNTDKQMC